MNRDVEETPGGRDGESEACRVVGRGALYRDALCVPPAEPGAAPDSTHRGPDAGEPLGRHLPGAAPCAGPARLRGRADHRQPRSARTRRAHRSLPFHKTSLLRDLGPEPLLERRAPGVGQRRHGRVHRRQRHPLRRTPIPTDPTGSRTMGYYDQTDLPFYYSLYNTFATNDRYFQSVLAQTFPNRLYLLAGTSFGHIRNDVASAQHPEVDLRAAWTRASRQLEDLRRDQYPLSFGSLFFKYVQRSRCRSRVPDEPVLRRRRRGNASRRVVRRPRASSTAPKVENDEHPPSQRPGRPEVRRRRGQRRSWRARTGATSALFLTYDEHGGFYDHVAPPAAAGARQHPADAPGRATRRVPSTATGSGCPWWSCRRTRSRTTSRTSSTTTRRSCGSSSSASGSRADES